MRSKKYLFNTATSLLLYIVTLFSTLILTNLIIRTFGSATNGLVSSITQFLSYITLMQAGIGAVTRAALYKPLAEANVQEISSIVHATEAFFRKIAAFFIVYIIALAFLYPVIISNAYGRWFTISLLIIIAFAMFTEYYFGMAYTILLNADQSIYVTNIVHGGLHVVNFLVAIILIKLGGSIQIVKLGTAVLFCARPLIIRAYVRKKYDILPANQVPKAKLAQKGAAVGQHIASFLHKNTDIILLTVLSSLKEVSVYAIYNMIAMALERVIMQTVSGVEAAFGDMYAKNELSKLRETLRKTNLLLSMVITVIISTALIVFTPFVKLYIHGVADANYIRPMLVLTMLASVFVGCIRLPYAWIIMGAGHFSQTQKAAYAEVVINIACSLVFFQLYGTVGLVIATILATLVRGFYFAYYASTRLLNISLWPFVYRFFVTLFNIAIIYFMYQTMAPNLSFDSYILWILNAIIIFLISMVITILANLVCFHRDMKLLFRNIQHILYRYKARRLN